MGNAVRTVGPPAAPNDRGSPLTAWHQIDWEKVERTVQSLCFRIFRNRLERHAGKLARAVLRGRGLGDRLLLPDRTLVPRSRFLPRLMPSVSCRLGMLLGAQASRLLLERARGPRS